LNDALAEYPSQFAGLKITLAPSQDDPAPMVEVKRDARNFASLDVDANLFEPEKSKGRVIINANQQEGIIMKYQKHANVVALLKHLEPDRTFALQGVSDMTNNVKVSASDIESFNIDEMDERLVGAMDYYIYEASNPDLPVIHMKLTKGIGTASFMWAIRKIDYRALASQIEEALPILAGFFRYDPQEDPELS